MAVIEVGGKEMRKRKNSVADSGQWTAYEYSVVRRNISDKERVRVTSPAELARAFEAFATNESSESLFVVAFDGQNGVIGVHRIYSGTALGTSVAIGELMRSAILMGGVGFALVHNHPSGLSTPSDEDIKLTREVIKAADLLDLVFLDHIVVSEGGKFDSIRSGMPQEWQVQERSN